MSDSEDIDLRIDVGLVTHPKTKKLRRLGGDAAFVSLIAIWAFARRYRATDGSLAGMPDDEIEDAAEWSGAPGGFIASMIAARFLTGEPGARQLHDWRVHQAWATGSGHRKLKAQWAAVCKWRGEVAADAEVPGWAAIRAAQRAQSGRQSAQTKTAVPPGGVQQSGDDASSNANSMPTASGEDATSNAPVMPTACAEHAHSNAPGMPPALPNHALGNPPSPSPSPSPQDQERERENARGRDSPPMPGAGSATVVIMPSRAPPTAPRPRSTEFPDPDIAAAFDRFCDRWHAAGQWDANRETLAARQVRHLGKLGFAVAALLDGAALAGKRDLVQYATSNESTYGPQGGKNASGTRNRNASGGGGKSLVERARELSGEEFDAGPPADYVEPTNPDFGPVTYA